MSEEKEFQRRIQRIGALVGEIEEIPDPVVRASTTQLVRLVMEFHGTGLDRVLEILVKSGDHGMKMIEELGRDPVVSSLLVLYGLHPDDLKTRVAKAITRLEPKLRRDGALIQLLSVSEDGAVQIRVTAGEHSCGSTAQALRATVEDEIYEAAPDLTALSIEGLEGKLASGFVSLDTLMDAQPASGVHDSPRHPQAAQYGD